jgi:hypothetical protein
MKQLLTRAGFGEVLVCRNYLDRVFPNREDELLICCCLIFRQGVFGRISHAILSAWFLRNGVPKGVRTPVTAVKGQCPRPLDDGDIQAM